MRAAMRTAPALVLCLLINSALAHESPQGLRMGELQRFSLQSSPFSGPVETIVMTNHSTIGRGGLMDVFVAVQNHSNDATVGVTIELDLRYAQGPSVQPFHLGTERVQTLGPDEGVGFFIFWLIPADAPLGAASLTVNARVTRLTDDTEGHAGNENPMVAADGVTFEVVP